MFSAGPAIWTFSAGDLALPYGHEFGMTKWSPLIWSYAESISNTFMHGREREWQHESKFYFHYIIFIHFKLQFQSLPRDFYFGGG